MSRQKTIAVRLDPAELTVLRQQPGDTDSERVRALLHNRGISAGLDVAQKAELMKLGDTLSKKIESAVQQITESDKRNLLKLVDALNPPVSEILTHTRAAAKLHAEWDARPRAGGK